MMPKQQLMAHIAVNAPGASSVEVTLEVGADPAGTHQVAYEEAAQVWGGFARWSLAAGGMVALAVVVPGASMAAGVMAGLLAYLAAAQA
jgi:hypothetical protein